MSDPTGNWPKWLQEIGNAVNDFFVKLTRALAQSISATMEFGAGLGGKAKVGSATVEIQGVLIADEVRTTGKGNKEVVSKTSLALQAEIVNDVGLGLDLEYFAPIDAAKEKGLLFADGGDGDAKVGLYAYDAVLGYSTVNTCRDFEVSFGLSAYFILGGGFDITINANEFIKVWSES